MNRIELIGLEILRAKIRGFHITGSKIAKKISKSKGLRKHQLWDLTCMTQKSTAFRRADECDTES